MREVCLAVLVALVLGSQTRLFSQTIRWESMDGPYWPERRTHLRFPDGERLFVGSNSGVYRTTDGGMTWTHLSPAPAPNFSVYQSTTGMLYGIGDTSSMGDHQDIVKSVIYTSSDRGTHWTWSRSGRIKVFANAFGRGDTVYQTDGFAFGAVGGATRIVRSTDAGLSWTTILSASAPRGFLGLFTQPDNIFVHVWGAELFGGQVKRSTDGGLTWQTLEADQAMFHPPNHLVRQRRDFSGDHLSANAYIEHSTDEGATWNTALTSDSGFASLVTNGLGVLLVLRKPALEIFRSTDAGFTWTYASSSPAGDPFVSLRFYGRTYVISTTLGGAYYRSTDYGSSWQPILDPMGSSVTGTVQPASDSLFVIAEESGRWLESTDAGGIWRSTPYPYRKGEIASLLVLPSGSVLAGSSAVLSWKKGDRPWSLVPGSPTVDVPATVWGLSYGSGNLFVAAIGTRGIMPRNQNGTICGLDTSDVPSGTAWWKGGGFEEPMPKFDYRCVLALSDGTVLTGWGNRILLMTDQGEDLPGGLASEFHFTAIVQDSARVLWAANQSAGVFKSTDLGVTWTGSDTGLAHLQVLSMTVAADGSLLIGTRADGVFRSTDGGDTWMPTGLSNGEVQVLASGSAGRVYAGLPSGVRMSTNFGETWTDVSAGLSNVDVHAFAVAPGDRVFCGTWGDGVYQMIESTVSVPSLVVPEEFSLSQNYPNPFNPRTTIEFDLPVSADVRLIVYDLLGREVSVLVNERKNAGTHKVEFDASTLASGVYLYRLTAGGFSHSKKLAILR